MQCVKRLFLWASYTRLTLDESNKINHGISNVNKKLLAQRKTRLSVVIFSYLLSNSFGIYNYVEMDTSDFVNQIVQYILIGFSCLDILCLLILCVARYHWNNYKMSSSCVISIYFIKIIVPIISLFVPYRELFNNDDMQDGLIQGVLLIVLSTVALNLLIPNITMIHNIITSSNTLAVHYPTTQEFKIASTVMLIFYVPIFMIVTGLVYQIDGFYQAMVADDLAKSYDKLIVASIMLYVAYIIVPSLFKGKYRTLMQMVLGIPLFVMMYFTLNKYDVHLLLIVVSGFISTLYTNMFVNDALITIVFMFTRPVETDDTPHNLFTMNADSNNNNVELMDCAVEV